MNEAAIDETKQCQKSINNVSFQGHIGPEIPPSLWSHLFMYFIFI